MTWYCRPCGQRISGGKAEHCPRCHQTFANTRAGDRHRVGPHDGNRRCLTVDEMEALTSKGKAVFEQNYLGHWTLASGPNPLKANRDDVRVVWVGDSLVEVGPAGPNSFKPDGGEK